MSESPARPPSPFIVREFNDRGTLWLLEDPAYMRDFIRIIDSTLADNLDFTRAERINRSFVAEDLQKLESDLIFQVPFVSNDTAVLVYILLEQQTRADRSMPLRLLRYCSALWTSQERAWEGDRVRPEDRWLQPVIPIVFYTGREPWLSSLTLDKMMAVPEPLKRFVPSWETLFLNLHQVSPERLTGFANGLGWALRALKAERAPFEVLESVVDDAMKSIENLPLTEAGQWKRCAWFLIQLAFHRRSSAEAPQLIEAIRMKSERSKFHEEGEVLAMQTYAEYVNAMGEARGELNGERRTVLRQGTSLFGPPDPDAAARLEAITSIEVLDEIALRIFNATSWDDVLHDL